MASSRSRTTRTTSSASPPAGSIRWRSARSDFPGAKRWSSARGARPARRSPPRASRSPKAWPRTSPAAPIMRRARAAPGYCVFNDAAVAARVIQADAASTRTRVRVAVIDLDVHQGDGTAQILGGDDSVFTLSMHGEKNFPFRKQAGHLDIGLPDGTGDDAYLAHLDRALAELESPLRAAADHLPRRRRRARERPARQAGADRRRDARARRARVRLRRAPRRADRGDDGRRLRARHRPHRRACTSRPSASRAARGAAARN